MIVPVRTLPFIVAIMAAAATCQAAAPPPQRDYAALAKLPDWSGVWRPARMAGGGPRNAPKPALTATAAKQFADYTAAQAKGENLQTEMANCVPPGMPQIMRMPYPIEFIYSPGRVTIAAETYSQVRRIYTDGQPLPDDPDPTFNGSSIGHWEGDTLVVDTIGVNPVTSIVAGVHPSEQMRVHETFHLEQPDLMLVTTTITDPLVLTEPLVQKQAYVRQRDWQIREYVCQENNHDAADEFGRPSFSLDEPKK